MIVTIDFNSDEAFYVQLCNQIIFGIANAEFREGDNLPSVRDLAEDIGINMHTVNKAYTILRQQGYVKLDRRKGAVIAVSADKYKAMEELANEMRVLLAKAVCKNISSEEVHEIVEQIFCDFCSVDREK
ncbi:GntR family transcriptional regulator [Anaerocolumna xylanovorans]|uniref:DNA-binding transcriptional regulator YhcF, GntR family n=1 Tax=Anaerocolumna xylanovorans DSM 12503 TaxID=1121345 RepID=A0A1M7YDC2_9FIRM|nr:DNA-binding transcriptional regulator YhcF, GntR family [Anaerocolumna xylanovorans DSM 12503]